MCILVRHPGCAELATRRGAMHGVHTTYAQSVRDYVFTRTYPDKPMRTTDGAGSFAALLRAYRAAVGLSQEELAEHTGLSRRGISALERGERRSPHPDTVRRLARALNLGPTERTTLLA